MMTTRTILTLTLATSAALGLAACRGERSSEPPRQFFPDMDDAPKWDPQSTSEFFVDSRTMRPRVEGTIAFGDSMDFRDESRADFLEDSPAYYRGIDLGLLIKVAADAAAHPAAEGAEGDHSHDAPAEPDPFAIPANDKDVFIARMPLEVTESLIKRGQERFNIYCAACHGPKGDGQGTVGQRWGYPVPSFHLPAYQNRAERTGKDGYIFHVARHGVPGATPADAPKMPGYSHALSERDSWAIVAYIRTLQASHVADLAKVAADELQKIMPSRDKAPDAPAPAAPAAPATPESSTGGAK